MDVSVIIVNYNVKDLVLQALKSIYTYTRPSIDLEVIVVDNASSDGSVEAINAAFPKTKIIQNFSNNGFPAANNQGFTKATGKYIFMLNPDTELLSDTIGTLYDYLEQNQDVSLIAPKLLNTDRSHQISAWRFPTIKSIFAEMYYLHFLLKEKNYRDKDYNEVFDADSFSGAALFFSKKLLDKIGWLDESMFWIEDIDFCYRIHQSKGIMRYIPYSPLVHHSGRSAKKSYVISISNQIFNKIKFYKKHHSQAQTNIIKTISFIHVLQKIILFSFLSPFSQTARLKRKAYVYTLPRIANPPIGIQ